MPSESSGVRFGSSGAIAGRTGEGAIAPTVGKQTLVEQLAADAPAAPAPVQRKLAADPDATNLAPDRAREIAGAGIRGSSGAPPHLDRMQRLFGRHDATSVPAHDDDAAASVGHIADQVQRQIARSAQPPEPPATTSAGAPLPEGVRGQMERSFGHDFSSVTVHQGGEARSAGALAFTRGERIHFAPGHYAPDSASGQELLGHELAHVVQQRGGTSSATGQDGPREAEADRAASAASRGERAAVSSGGAPAMQCRLAQNVIQGVQAPGVSLALTQHNLNDRLQSILAQLVLYDNLSLQHQEGQTALPILDQIVVDARACEKVLIDLREALEKKGLMQEHTVLGNAKKPLVDLANAAGNEIREIRKRVRTNEYQNMEQPTQDDIGQGTGRHLLISPHPLGRGGATGQQYPDTVPLDKRYTLALPPDDHGPTKQFSINVVGTGRRTLDVLVVGGGHGGMGELFEQDWQGSRDSFNKQYWRTQVVDKLVNSGVRARFIVLDACLTGSLISVFAPLLTNDGRIICSMTSTPRTIVGPGTWTQLIQAIDSQEKNGVARVLAQSANDVQQSVGCGVFGVFDGSSRTLTFDEHVGMPDPTLDSKTTLGREQEVGQITSQTQQSGFQTDPKRNFNYSQALAPTPSSRVYLFLTLGIAIVVGVAGVILRFL